MATDTTEKIHPLHFGFTLVKGREDLVCLQVFMPTALADQFRENPNTGDFVIRKEDLIPAIDDFEEKLTGCPVLRANQAPNEEKSTQ